MPQTASLHWNVLFFLITANGIVGQDAVTVGNETGLDFIFAKTVMEAFYVRVVLRDIGFYLGTPSTNIL
jgi:hypothetical protein